MDLKHISQLNFGFADAREYQSGAQANKFKSIFYEDPKQIDRLKNEPVYYVVGDKGTGKTALATYFINELDDDVVGLSIFLQQDDFTRFYDFSTKIEGFDKTDSGEMWKAIFSLLLCFRGTEEAVKAGSELNDSAKNFIEALQKQSFNSFDLTVYSAFKILFSQVKATAQNFLGADYTNHEQFSFYLRAMQKYFLDLYEELPASGKRTFLFVDGLDVRPTKGSGSRSDHISSVTGLINSVYQMNQSGITSRKNGHYKIIALVRPDIFEKLELQNVNSIWRTNTIQITYDVIFKRYRESRLFKIADHLLYSQQDYFPKNSYQVGECWDGYLNEKFERFSSQSKNHSESSFIGILRDTFNRPRDIVYFLNYWKIIAEGVNDANGVFFDPRYTRYFQFRNLFNDYLLGEIRDSLAFYTDVSSYIVFIQFFHHLGEKFERIELDSTKYPGQKFTITKAYFDSEQYWILIMNFWIILPKVKLTFLRNLPSRSCFYNSYTN